MRKNLLLQTDSYKASHSQLYPPGTENLYCYLESRGGKYGSTVFFGLQYLIKEYFDGYVFDKEDIEEAADFFGRHGEPFDAAGWGSMLNHHGGTLPIRIRAVPEGTVVPTHNVLMTVEATDRHYYWLPSYLETMLVRGLWYPTTVATQSYYIKRIIRQYLEETADAPAAELPFKLHDFGARGVSSAESAAIGGAAHLVNFMGSDTVEGVRMAEEYYGTSSHMPAYSIPATEHSTIISWGKDREGAAYSNVVDQFAKPGKIFACVSDSYDLWNAIENHWCGDLRDRLEKSGATLVIRPDSGDPASVVLKSLQTLERKVGAPQNMRGFKLLPKWVRLIQGDGINEDSITQILSTMKAHGYSASNVAFGMGGALLQQVNRDTQRFAYKVSEATINNERVPVCKDPITDPGKRSKSGRFALVKRDGALTTVPGPARDDLLRTVFEDGDLVVDDTFDAVRSRAV